MNNSVSEGVTAGQGSTPANRSDNNNNNASGANQMQGKKKAFATINMCDEEISTSDFCFHQRENKIEESNEAVYSKASFSQFPSGEVETPDNLRKWLLLDSASTTHLFTNKQLVSNIRNANVTQGVISNGGQLEVDKISNVKGLGEVPYSDEGIANLVSLGQLVKQGYRIVMDSAIDDAIQVYTPDGKRMLRFAQSKNGLYYHDTENRQVVMMNSQLENSEFYTKRQVQRAKQARNLYQMIGYPSINDYKNAIKYKYLDDCPVTIQDIEIAEDIFGPDIYALKGKTVRKSPNQVRLDTIAVPKEIIELHKNVILGVDLMMINKNIFLVSVSRNIKFMTTEFIENMELETILECLKKVIEVYHKGGFYVRHILADLQFEGLSDILYQKYNITYNAPSAFEHVGEIERSIRTLKERIRATLSRLPYKERIPKMIIQEAVANTVLMVNSFPPKSGLTTHMSPRTIMTGRKISYKSHCRLPFGDYAQVHENEQPRNSMAERTLGAICLGPIDNAQGGYKFMSLKTGKKIRRYAWTPIPMTSEVIARVIEIASRERGPKGISLKSANKNQAEAEEYIEADDIEGVYSQDIMNNDNYPSQEVGSDVDEEEDSII